MTGHEIINAVAAEHNVEPQAILAMGRYPHLVAARQEAIRRMANEGFGVSKIARIMKRDHSTISYVTRPDYQARKIERMRQYRSRREAAH